MLFLVAPFESENIVKGISSRNLEIIKTFQDESEIILSSFDHRYKVFNNKNTIKEKLHSLGIRSKLIFTISYKNNISIRRVLSNFIFSFNVFIYLFRRVNENDVVYINLIPPECTFFMSLLCRFKKAKLVGDLRDVWPDAFISQSKNSLLSRLFELYCNTIYKISVNRLDKLIYVAPSFKHWIERNGLLRTKAKFIPLGYDDNRWSNVSVKSSLRVEGMVNCVYVGYLSHQFDLSTAIASIKGRNDIVLHIIGGGEYEEYYHNMAVQCDNIKFYGMQNPQFISDNISQFDFAILPLRAGAEAKLPNKFFDYVAAKLPILSYGSEDVNNLIITYDLGWSVNDNIPDFSDKVESIIKENKFNIIKHNFDKHTSDWTMQRSAAIICEFMDYD